MARKPIDIGTIGNDGTGDSIRDSFRKVNDNFRELYSSLGLGERLTFLGLGDTPDAFAGNEDAVLTVNRTADSVVFKQIVGDVGIAIDTDTNANEIRISSEFSEISADKSPQLGGNLNAVFGGVQYRINNLATPITDNEASTKSYTDTKISLAGVDAIDPETNATNSAFGQMSGPLILSRNPTADDDNRFDGLIAATKSYVDNAAFGSSVNLYVATSGQDERPDVDTSLQGRALAYAFRTLEAALKRAEELVLESQNEIGPYEKLLTFNNRAGIATLDEISSSPVSGTGFVGTPTMSVSTISLKTSGSGYNPGEIIQIKGGTGTAATIEVLSTNGAFGPITTFRLISTGVYSVLPGTTVSLVNAIDDGADTNGVGATFDVTYSVSNVTITNPGSGYSLVSVRITGDDGTGAFGVATVDSGQITAIEITDAGTGFTSIPTVNADIPRFLLRTDGFRTDFTGDVVTETPEAFRSRDIREGLFLRGVNSGALAQIVGHNGELDSQGREFFDVDIQFGNFEIDEPITYGDRAKQIQITVLVESGIYEENMPLKVPTNTSIVGDEFRRVIVRPRSGTSSSPWAFQKFRRDPVIDGLQVTDRFFGYHYLQDTSQPVYPKINNPGGFDKGADLIALNKKFLQNEIIAWIADQVENETAPFTASFEYDSEQFKTNIGILVDSYIFDLRYGEYNRTISSGLKYYQDAGGRKFINEQLSQTTAAFNRLKSLLEFITQNSEITSLSQTEEPQIIDGAFISKDGINDVIGFLHDSFIDVIDGSGSVNYPKENNAMDVFLANDTVRWQAITCQGHGGFMLVLDPQGQILAKSPYAQECASFSRSIDAQIFAGGMFVDGFAGNLEFQILSKDSNTRLRVGGLDRFPELPASFIVSDTIYRINYVRDFTYSPSGSTATLVLDETTPYPFPVFQYNDDICSRDVGLILDGLGYDLVLGTNYNSRKSALTYRLANAAEVIENQQDITARAITLAHELAAEEVNPALADQVILSGDLITTVINRGAFFASPLTFTEPTGVASNISNAKDILLANFQFIEEEVAGYLQTTYPTIDINISTFKRDMRYIIEALVYDVLYGGNSQTVDAGLKYYDGVGDAIQLQIDSDLKDEYVDSIDYLKDLAKTVIVNGAPGVNYSSVPQDTSLPASDATIQSEIETLLADTSDIVNNGTGSAPTIVYPDLDAYTYPTIAKSSRTTLLTEKSSIQSQVIDFVDENANLFEILMPGNRSMLSNDFTQIADMGYGLLATNGGLTEAVSMFTYYCYTSYMSINGAQIRSVGGSSAHGVYALVAEGSDPLEVPTPTSLFFDLAQRVDCYFPNATYKNEAGGKEIFVFNYDYVPRGNAELEVDHGNLIFRYPVTSVDTSGLPEGVARLNLSSEDEEDEGQASSDGLFAIVPNGTKMSIRSNSKIVLTGGLEDVAVRPSTGLVLTETSNREGQPDTVYRVLQFDAVEDERGPFEVEFTDTSPTDVTVLAQATEIESDNETVVFEFNTGLRLDDPVIPQTTANGLTEGVTYFVTELVDYQRVKLSAAVGGSALTLTGGIFTTKFVVPHKLTVNYSLIFDSSGTLPVGIDNDTVYFVSPEGLETLSFRIAETRDGAPVSLDDTGSGKHVYSVDGITDTILRENYDYIDLTLAQPGEFVSLTDVTIQTDSAPNPAVFTTSGAHGFSQGDSIGFATNNDEDIFPTGLSNQLKYFVFDPDPDSVGAGSTKFTISFAPPNLAGTEEIITEGGGNTSSAKVGLIYGRPGDEFFAVTAVPVEEESRVLGCKVLFKGEEYIVTAYENTVATGEAFGRVTLNRPLVDSLIEYEGSYNAKGAVPIRTLGAEGRLTIRISLTRVTSHDLLEIGTGSYADTNYPNEIFGGPVNPVDQEGEVDERDVGRVFYVTTDQFGNFRVGPFFTVDQGTGRVTFSAAIALSNLDGIGFKRGVAVSEFSVDNTFVDNATDTVPTENAVRGYIDKRLGVTHSGALVPDENMIPSLTGGFMALSGQLPMRENMSLGNNKIVLLSDPANPQDAVNLRSLTFENFQDYAGNNTSSSDILVFTGDGNNSVNATVIGDITFDLRTGVDSSLNQINVQINNDTIIDANIKLPTDNTEFTSEAILQSKLNMNKAGTRASAQTGDEQTIQATLGIASFNSAEFDDTDGWIELTDNGIVRGKLETLAARSVLGNSATTPGDVGEVTFANVVDLGGAIKKNQYGSTGFLRRVNSSSSSSDGDYSIIDMAVGTAAAPEASKLIVRNVNGDFGARIADLSELHIDGFPVIDSSTTASGGYNQMYTYGGEVADATPGAGGILLFDGEFASDARNEYWNDDHIFRSQNGEGLAPIECSQVNTTAITTGGEGEAGSIEGSWTLVGNSTFEATYAADLAEYYEGDAVYEAGTVLIFGGDKEVTTTTKYADTKVAGVISNNAAYIMNGACPGDKNLLALAGRVLCKVVGKIEKGDLITTSEIQGVACAVIGDAKTGTILGKALENYNSEHVGTIEVAVGRS